MTLAQAIAEIRAALAAREGEMAAETARRLVAEVAGASRADLIAHPERPLPTTAATRLQAMAARALSGEPISRILGRRGFWSLELQVAPGVLDPRADSETVIAATLERLGARRREPLRMLDLGTGSGALILALLAECPEARGLALDANPAACALATRNARAAGLGDQLTIVEADWRAEGWTSGLGRDARFDVIVSNPPYVARAALADLPQAVADHDPPLALDGGEDGLDAYRALARPARALLAPDGVVAFEVGVGQADAVSALLASAGFRGLAVAPDLAGHGRCVSATV